MPPKSKKNASPVDIPPALPTAAILLAQSSLLLRYITTASPAANPDMEQRLLHAVQQRVSAARHPALAITDDETDGEEKARPHTSKGATGSSGKLRSANTSAKHTVIWPHEYVYTPEG